MCVCATYDNWLNWAQLWMRMRQRCTTITEPQVNVCDLMASQWVEFPSITFSSPNLSASSTFTIGRKRLRLSHFEFIERAQKIGELNVIDRNWTHCRIQILHMCDFIRTFYCRRLAHWKTSNTVQSYPNLSCRYLYVFIDIELWYTRIRIHKFAYLHKNNRIHFRICRNSMVFNYRCYTMTGNIFLFS